MSLLSLSMWIALPALASSDSKFAALRSAADPLGNLSSFLEKYIGDCDSGSGPRCHAQAISFRETSNGRRFVIMLGDDSARLLSAGRFDAASREYELRLTPFFAAGRYAVTHGAPKQTDNAGNPLLPLLTMRRRAPEDWDATRLQRLITGRELRVEVVFTPQDVWTLPRKRGERIRGIKSRINALQVTNGRTGEIVGSWP